MLKVRSRDITACFGICFLPDLKVCIQGRSVDSLKGITSFLPFVRCLGLFEIRLVSFLSFVLCPVFLTFCTGTGVLCLWNWLEMLTSFFLVVRQPGKLSCFSWQWILWSSDFLRLASCFPWHRTLIRGDSVCGACGGCSVLLPFLFFLILHPKIQIQEMESLDGAFIEGSAFLIQNCTVRRERPFDIIGTNGGCTVA